MRSCPLLVVVPLVRSEFPRTSRHAIDRPEIAPWRKVHGVPTHARGGHVRLAEKTLRPFVKSHELVRCSLAQHLETQNWREAVDLALFHVPRAPTYANDPLGIVI